MDQDSKSGQPVAKTVIQNSCSLSRLLRLVLGAVFILSILGACANETKVSSVHYVSAAAASGGDGKSWETAFDHPQDALDIARYGDEVWVAAGNYEPIHTDGREVIVLVTGVAVLGGFDGTETLVWQREHLANTTVLDGQGISYHVVRGADEAVLDGFTVTGGNANGNIVQGRYGGTYSGGGMFNAGVSPRILNCIFTGNYALSGGGAIFNERNRPVFEDCVFEKNQADFGGAMENRVSEPLIINSLFKGNTSFVSGGGVASFEGGPTFVNSIFSGNISVKIGGAVLSNKDQAVFTNCSFTGNRADYGGGVIGAWRSSVKVTNSILWDNRSVDGRGVLDVDGNVTVNFSLVQGGYAGTGNLDAHPGFIKDGQWETDGNWVEGDYKLAAASPAIDSGTAAGAPDYDAEYNTRPQALAHDLGAYERLDQN